jgi:hypothetical protein
MTRRKGSPTNMPAGSASPLHRTKQTFFSFYKAFLLFKRYSVSGSALLQFGPAGQATMSLRQPPEEARPRGARHALPRVAVQSMRRARPDHSMAMPIGKLVPPPAASYRGARRALDSAVPPPPPAAAMIYSFLSFSPVRYPAAPAPRRWPRPRLARKRGGRQ